MSREEREKNQHSQDSELWAEITYHGRPIERCPACHGVIDSTAHNCPVVADTTAVLPEWVQSE